MRSNPEQISTDDQDLMNFNQLTYIIFYTVVIFCLVYAFARFMRMEFK